MIVEFFNFGRCYFLYTKIMRIAFSPLYDLAPPPQSSPSLPSASCLSFSAFLCVAGKGGDLGRGWGSSQTLRLLESLVLYKSWNTLWAPELTKHNFIFYPIPQTKLSLSNARNFSLKKLAMPKIEKFNILQKIVEWSKIILSYCRCKVSFKIKIR